MTKVIDKPITDADLRTITGIRPEEREKEEARRELPPRRPSWLAVFLAILVAVAAVALLVGTVIEDIVSDDEAVPTIQVPAVEVLDPAVAEHTISPLLYHAEVAPAIEASELTVWPWTEVKPVFEVKEHTVTPGLFQVQPFYETEEHTVWPGLYH